MNPAPGDGYRRRASGGPALRSDIVDVYIFRRTHGGGVEFLQLLRAADPLGGTWHPVMGHCEAGETAPQTAQRELAEETGLRAGDPAFRGLWALEQVHPFYIARINCIVLAPRFCAEAAPGWEPRLCPEHTAARWVGADGVDSLFMWPGQKAAIAEILCEIVNDASLSRDRLRIL